MITWKNANISKGINDILLLEKMSRYARASSAYGVVECDLAGFIISLIELTTSCFLFATLAFPEEEGDLDVDSELAEPEAESTVPGVVLGCSLVND